MYNIRLAQTALKKQANSPTPNCQISSISLDVEHLKDLDQRIRQSVSILRKTTRSTSRNTKPFSR